MAQSLQSKQLNFLTRLNNANLTLIQTVETLAALKAEWDANAYATGASPSGNNLTDVIVQAGFPYETALIINQLIGAHVAIKVTVDANRGYLEAARG